MKRLVHIALAALCAITVVLPLGVISVYAAEDKGLTFSSVDMYALKSNFDKTPNTFEAWVKLPKSAASSRGGIILGNYGIGRPVVNFEIHKNGSPRLYWTDKDGVNASWVFSNVNVCNGQWTHVAIVRDIEAKKVHCYINGVRKQTMQIVDDKGAANVVPTAGLCLGGDMRSGNSRYFRGEIRSVAVYSAPLGADAIGKDPAENADSLLLSYELSISDSKTDIVDKSGNGRDAVYYKNVLWVAEKDMKPPGDYAYSFAFIGDTQTMNYVYPTKFGSIYSWIVDNVEEHKIRFVFGLGDITEKSEAAEWERAKEAIHSMDGKVEYSIVRGNHDKTAGFNNAFPWSDYKDVFDGSYNSTMINTYRTLEIGEVKYLLITLDYGANDSILRWASKIIEKHPEHNVIITTHAYLYRDGTTLDKGDVCPPTNSSAINNNGDDMWNELMSKHENIVLVVSGHDPCDRIVTLQSEGEHGNIVTQMLIDSQSTDKELGGLGMVAMFYFSEDGREVQVRYYSTVRKQYYGSLNQFSLTLDTVSKSEPVTEPVTESVTGQTGAPATDLPATAPAEKVPDGTEEKSEGISPAVFAAVCAVALCAVIAALIFAVKAKKK